MALKFSPGLAISLLLSHLLAAGVLLLTVLPALPKLAIFLAIVASLGYNLARDAFQLLPHSWLEISLSGGVMSVTARSGLRISGSVSGATFVSPYFIVLGLCPEERRLPVFRVVFPDAMGREAFREFSVRLRFG